MIICLYGEDSYRRGKKLKEIISSYKTKNPSMDLQFFNLEEFPDDWKTARDFLEQPSMFANVKCAVIKSATLIEKKEWKKFIEAHINTKDIFIIISEKNKPKKIFEFLIKKPSFSQEFSLLKGERLKKYLKKDADDRKLLFSPDAWMFFIEYVLKNGGVWAGINELDKIELAKLKQPVSLNDVKSITNWFLHDEVFFTTRRFSEQATKEKKLFLLEKLFTQKESPAHIFNSLTYNTRGKNTIKLSAYDVAIKSGKLEYEEALLDLILR